MCRRKRLERFLKPVRDSDKHGSKVWICNPSCLDGRMNKKAQSFLQLRLSARSQGLSNDDHKLALDQVGKSDADLTKANPPGGKAILDACCGFKKMWFNKDNPHVLFADVQANLPKGTVIQDFRAIKYKDKSFKMVVFDPPHIFEKSGPYSWINKEYGTLSIDNWPTDIKQGLEECWRVLDDWGTLIFKWSEGSISVSTILTLCPVPPLFGHTSDKRGKTHWLVFMKIPKGQ